MSSTSLSACISARCSRGTLVADPTNTTEPGLGPVKKPFNKKVLVSAIVAGFIVAGAKLWPQYADLFDGLRQALGF